MCEILPCPFTRINLNQGVRDKPNKPAGYTLYQVVCNMIIGFEVSEFTCELDEYAELVKQIKASGIVKSNGSFLWSYKNTFKGKELVDWLVSSKEVGKLKRVLYDIKYSLCHNI